MYHSNYGQVIKDAVFSHNLDEPPKNCSLFVVVEMVLVMAQPCKKLLCSNYGRKTICLRLKEEPSKNTAWKFGRWDGFSVFLSFPVGFKSMRSILESYMQSLNRSEVWQIDGKVYVGNKYIYKCVTVYQSKYFFWQLYSSPLSLKEWIMSHASCRCIVHASLSSYNTLLGAGCSLYGCLPMCAVCFVDDHHAWLGQL